MTAITRLLNIVLCISVTFLNGCGGSDANTEVVSDTIVAPTPTPEETDTSDENDDSLAALSLPDEPYQYANISLPEHLTQNQFPANQPFQLAAIDTDNSPVDNPITDNGATLGRVLFYDKSLSANGTIACASCHQPEAGFSDPNVLSIGFEGGETRRHSMSIVNSRFYESGTFFWDERAGSLEEQVLMPFQDPIEMGLVLPELEELVRNQSYYPSLFENAFGDPDVSGQRIASALAQFVRSMVSTTAPYDLARAAVSSPLEDFPDFNEQENYGKTLFYTERLGTNVSCASCHASEAFVSPIPPNTVVTTASTSNGLDAESNDDLGIFETTGDARDIGKFKAPSLRNIAVTAPYMHDGRFASLEEVIDFYSHDIQPHINLPPILRDENGAPFQFNFNDEEKAALIAFFNTLTDSALLTDPKFSDPFL